MLSEAPGCGGEPPPPIFSLQVAFTIALKTRGYANPADTAGHALASVHTKNKLETQMPGYFTL
eukprot:2166035-Karenia_brevis.AAC.1